MREEGRGVEEGREVTYVHCMLVLSTAMNLILTVNKMQATCPMNALELILQHAVRLTHALCIALFSGLHPDFISQPYHGENKNLGGGLGTRLHCVYIVCGCMCV